MKKNIWMRIMMIGLLCLSLVACSSEQGSEPNVPTEEPKQEQTLPEQPQPKQEQQPNESDQPKEEIEAEKVIWKFTGVVDTHSAEFMVDNEPLVAEYPEEMRTTLESLEENQEVEVQYKKDENGRFILEKIEKVQ